MKAEKLLASIRQNIYHKLHNNMSGAGNINFIEKLLMHYDLAVTEELLASAELELDHSKLPKVNVLCKVGQITEIKNLQEYIRECKFKVGQLWEDSKNERYQIISIVHTGEKYPMLVKSLSTGSIFYYTLNGEFALPHLGTYSEQFKLIILVKEVE